MMLIILAAGVGRRLHPLTATIPKTLLRVRDKAILEHICDAARMHGLTQVTIVTGHGHDAVAMFTTMYQERYPAMQFQLRHNEQFETMGNVQSLSCVRDIIAHHDVCVINSDTLFHPDLLRALKDTPHEHAMIVDDHKTLGEEEMKVTVTEDGHITMITKTLSPSTAMGEYVGLLKLSSSASTALQRSLDDQLNENDQGYYEDALQRLIRDHGITIQKISTDGLPVMEIDTHEDLREAQNIQL